MNILKKNLFKVFSCLIIIIYLKKVSAVNLIAYISQNGLHGEIIFQQQDNKTVKIQSKLNTTLQYPEQIWSWGVHEFPVDYTDTNSKRRCDNKKIGDNFISFDEDLGYLTLPGNESSIWNKEMQLTGNNGIWGKSLVLSNPNNNFKICATITTIDQSLEHLAEARFYTPFAGSIYFRWLASTETDQSDTLIFSNLYNVAKKSHSIISSFTEHIWKIYVTDIFENDHHRSEDNCNFLQLVFDPNNEGIDKGIGDLNSRLGKIKIATNPQRKEYQILYRDEKLKLLPSDLTIPHRTLYLVIFDDWHSDKFLACAKIRHVNPILLKAYLNADGMKGEISLRQRSKFDPTFLNFTIKSAENSALANKKYAEDVSMFKINTLPPSPQKAADKTYCLTTGNIFDTENIENEKEIPPPGFGTQDQYAIGDLSGKLQSRNKNYHHNYFLPGSSSELSGIYWDVFLPLQGQNSVSHRGLVVYRYNRSNPHCIKSEIWACGTILHYQRNGIHQKTIFTAQIDFRYPLVGRILFRQPKEEPWQDTTIIIEYLIHADGSSINNTDSHRWAIHLEPPGKDFYNWSERCLSADEMFNPYKVDFDVKNPEKTCTHDFSLFCRLGDMVNKLGALSIAGSRIFSQKISRKLFTDIHLPLSGRHNILGRSLVIYDDFGPKARGERLACSKISGHYRRKAVAKEWFPNGSPLTVTGKVEIVQQSEYDLSNVDVEFKGLNKNSGYHIHMTPVEASLEFPCEASSLYDHWNPRNISKNDSPLPSTGSTDQYEMGDLSGKFGLLDNHVHYEIFYNDSNLPLFGYESIIGRSVVIHKKEKNLRWVCSTIERGYSPSEAREIRAIVSFHNPAGYAYGYMRMTQLIHKDGSQSDTVIEIKLRHPGKNDRNVTRNHHWQIFVNPVGVDAVVQQTITRCVAGGYVWNPYYTQLADPLNIELYEHECAPDNPLRCYVGDVSARVGTIDIGDKRVVLTDQNFPLEGQESAIGRSIVIFGPEKSRERYACANIEPDHDIIKYINLQRPPRFVVAQFLEDVRKIMGIPEWMLDIDARKTKILHNGACIQMIMHFKGPIAHKLEQDFSRMLIYGRLDEPSLYIPGYTNKKRKSTISYKTCGVRDPNEKNSKMKWSKVSSVSTNIQPKLVIIFICLIFKSSVLYLIK